VTTAVGDIISVIVQAINPLDYSRIGAVTAVGAATTVLDAQEDPDLDGMNNGAEELAGTDPFDAKSALNVGIARMGGGSIALNWPSVPGKSYRVQWCDNLATAFTVTGQSTVIPASSGTTTMWTDQDPSASNRFYRIILVP
jgi:hypothetical protein